jgi:selenocysteine lyase/cysteine desulfurase
VDAAALRSQFPVFERLAYLNAGTCGPVPAASVRASGQVLEAAAAAGRAAAYFEQLGALRERQRAAYAALVGGEAADVALTTCTSEGIVRVLAGLGLREGDEIVTSDEEHPGLLGPLGAARAQLGVRVREVPFEELPDAAGPATRLIACSHVGWVSGKLVGDLRGLDVPVLLDGAQGVGAVPTDVRALGATFYAAAGQKWLCGPVGSGLLWVDPDWHERLQAPGPTYLNLADAAAGLDAPVHADARRHDAAALSLEAIAAAAAAFVTLAEADWAAVHERAATLAARFAGALAEHGRTVAPRGRTTLLSWEDPDPPATRDRLAASGIVVRDLPGTPLLRASVGAWNDESDLERLLAAL